MKQLPSANTAVKPFFGDTSGERDLVLCALRVASGETRLIANQLETIGASLRQKAITCQGALEWLAELGLMHLVKFGPEARK